MFFYLFLFIFILYPDAREVLSWPVARPLNQEAPRNGPFQEQSSCQQEASSYTTRGMRATKRCIPRFRVLTRNM